MTPLRKSFLSLLFASAVALASVDSGLLNLVPVDATAVSGIQVDQSKASPFGQYVLKQMTVDDTEFEKFITETGFDLRRDLNELLIATTPNGQALLLGRGAFNAAKILNAASSYGATASKYNGVDLSQHKEPNGGDNAVAFLDASTALMGNSGAVKAAIDQRLSSAKLSAAILTKIHDLAAANDAWFLSTGPLSTFMAGKVPNQEVNQAMNSNLFQAVLQASGGLKFGAKVITVSGEALTRSDKDAQALADVLRFVAGLVQTNAGNHPQAKKAATLLDSLQLSTQAATMKLSLTIPEEQAEQLFMPQGKVRARKATAQR